MRNENNGYLKTNTSHKRPGSGFLRADPGSGFLHTAGTCTGPILEDNLSRDFRYQMSNIKYPHVNNDFLWV